MSPIFCRRKDCAVLKHRKFMSVTLETFQRAYDHHGEMIPHGKNMLLHIGARWRHPSCGEVTD